MSFSIFAQRVASVKLPDDVAFSIGGLSVYWYGVLLAAALLTALLLIHVEAKRKGMGPDLATDLCLVVIPAGLVGARLFYVFTFLDAFRDNPARVLYLWDGGLSVYGALAFGAAGVLIYAACKKTPLLELLDTLSPALAFAPGVAVWGDFFNQRGYGPEIVNRSLQWFPFAVLIERTDTIHYAAFFYEFVWCALLFLFVWLYLRKRAKRDGTVFFTCLALFSLGHGLIEQLRVDAPCLFGSMKTATVVCAALFALSGIALLIIKNKPLPAPLSAPDAADAEADCEAAPVKIVKTVTEAPPESPDEPARPAPTEADDMNLEESDHA